MFRALWLADAACIERCLCTARAMLLSATSCDGDGGRKEADAVDVTATVSHNRCTPGDLVSAAPQTHEKFEPNGSSTDQPSSTDLRP